MNIKNVINNSDSKLDSMVKIQGTNYDRRRKVTKSMKHRMEQMYNSGKSYYTIGDYFNVSPKTVRYNLDENFRQNDIDARSKRAKNSAKKVDASVKAKSTADRIAYKKELMQNKNFRKVAVIG